MSYFGAYYGAPTVVTAPPAVVPPAPVPSPVTVTEPEYVDHAALMISRLVEQFKAKDNE